ncbi:MAG: hypothetical protein RIB60_07410 [Phycisphaerales bacterium]
MPPPPTSNLRVVKYAQGWGYAASEWERALGAIDWSKPHTEGGPERLKIKTLPDGTKDATVWRATLTLGRREHEVVLKVERLGSLRKKIQAWLHRTKAFRQWRGARLLTRSGLRTASAHAVLRSGGFETLVLESIPGRTVLELMADPTVPVRLEHRVASALGALIGECHRAGVYSADMKPSNLIDIDEGRRGIAIIDSTDVRRGVDPARQLFDLLVEPAGLGLVPRSTLRHRVVGSLWANGLDRGWGPDRKHAERDLARGVKRRLRAHGDPTPKDDPLARG